MYAPPDEELHTDLLRGFDQVDALIDLSGGLVSSNARVVVISNLYCL